MIIKIQKKIEFLNDCNCLVNYKLLEKAIKWYSNKPVARIKHIYLYGKYPAVSIYEQKIHIHRLLIMYFTKRDLESNIYVHHIDGNPLNNLEINLEIMEASKHQSLSNKGKQLSGSHKNKIGEANKKRVGTKYKERVHIPISELKELLNKKISINKIAKHFNCDWSTIKNRIYENPELLKE